jgi:hypothetical protein
VEGKSRVEGENSLFERVCNTIGEEKLKTLEEGEWE